MNLLSFSFLYDEQSPAHRFYKKKVKEYRAANSQNSADLTGDSRTAVKPPAAFPVPEISPQQSQPSALHFKESETPPVKRKRKSRWGSEEDKVDLPIPLIVVPHENSLPDPNAPSLSGIYFTNVQVLFMCLFVGDEY